MLVYCVSPNYLEFMMEEFKMLDTVMQGYGNFKDASANLLSINKSDLLGVLVVADIVKVNNKNFQDFLSKLNLTGKVRIVFAVKTSDNLREISSLKHKYPNLEMYGLSDYVMTDVFIRHELLGTLLKETDAYVRIKSATTDYSKVLNTGGSSYSALVHKDVELCEQDNVKLNLNYDEAVIQDDNLPLIQSEVFKEIRMLKIKYYHGEAELQDFYDSLKLCDSLNGTNKWLAISIIHIMKEGYLHG